MKLPGFIGLATLVFTLAASPALAAPAAQYWGFWDASNEANLQHLDHTSWDRMLQKYATLEADSGIVRFSYDDLTRDDLNNIKSYISYLEDSDPRRYPMLEQKAYWMNLYNALTILAVRDNYKSLNDSEIQQGLPEEAWAIPRVRVAGQKLSLNDIEHRILRPIFRDHRIHFGLNCTTLDCPNLSERAYTAATIKSQLKTAGKRFINNNIGVRYSDGVLHASRIFKEYFGDFAKDEKTLMKVFAHYAEDMKALYMLGHTGEINYVSDSRLNIR